MVYLFPPSCTSFNSFNIYQLVCKYYVEIITRGKNSGSLASANFLLIEELLKRDYEIDFYAIKGFQQVEDFYSFQNFRYIPISLKIMEFVWKRLEYLPHKGGVIYSIFARINTYIYFKEIEELAKRNHRNQAYDLVLILGLSSFLKIRGIPTISWLQGTFDSEWESIEKLKRQIILLCGIKEYWKLKIFYLLKSYLSNKIYNKTDIFICCSQWAKEKLCLWGLDKTQIKVLPYPIDISFFKPDQLNKYEEHKKITFLWLGRIVPRKRIDLLLEAFRMLVKENKNLHLKIVGNFAYAQGYRKLIDNFELPDHISYQAGINRLNVPELMNSVDVLIQPSECEDFGSSVAEALSCGVSVIVGATNGTKYYISNSSWIFEQYTVESLKKTMEMAISSIEKNRETISLEARLTAEREFSVVKVVDKLETIFAEAVRK